MITARKAKNLDATTMFTYFHANIALAQSERAYHLSYFINGYVGLCMAMYGYVGLCRAGCGCVWQSRTQYGYVGPCMAMYDCVGLSRAKYGYVRLCGAM